MEEGSNISGTYTKLCTDACVSVTHMLAKVPWVPLWPDEEAFIFVTLSCVLT